MAITKVPRLDLEIIKGADNKLFALKWANPDGTEIVLAGMTAHMQVKTSANGTVLLDLQIGSGITIESNAFVARVSDEASAAITGAAGVYDFFVTDTLGERTKLVYGNVIITENITDA